jgi:CheY-like chemotaxis protein
MGSVCEEPTAAARPLRILVVEHHADAAASLAGLLDRCGYEAQAAPDGPSALEAARSNPPDVVLLDLALTGKMDGWQFAAVLRQQPALRQPLLIAVTGFGSDADRRQSRQAGIDLQLVKPVEANQLRGLLSWFQRLLDPTPVPLGAQPRSRVQTAARRSPGRPISPLAGSST